MRIRIALFLFVLAGVLVFVSAGFSTGHSARFNYTWTTNYLDVFNWNALLPRHLPGLWSGLGGYDFFFYAPIPFWFIAAFVSPLCVDCTLSTQIVLGAAMFWLLGGFTFYLFARRYMGSRFAVLGAIAYAILPYHLWLDWFVRQAFGEFAAYAFIPLIAYGLDAIRLNTRHASTFSIGVAGTALCHLPTALLAAHVFGVVICVLAWQKYREKGEVWRFLKAVVGWGVLGGLLSCFYWLPALSLVQYVSSDLMYSDHFIADRWLYGLGFSPPGPNFARVILWSFLAVLPFVVAGAFTSVGSMRIWIIVPVVTVVVLNTDLTEFLWKYWIIQKVQFPWRLMVFVDFSAAFAMAFLLNKCSATASAKALAICVVLAALPVVMVGKAAHFWVVADHDPRGPMMGAQEYLSPEMVEAAMKRPGFGTVNSQNQLLFSDHMQEVSEMLAEKNAPLLDIEMSHRRVVIQPRQEVDQISIPVQYWLLWRAELEGGTALVVSPNPAYGTIDIQAPPGGFQARAITLTLPYHWSEKVGFLVTLLSAALLLFLTLRPKVRRGND